MRAANLTLLPDREPRQPRGMVAFIQARIKAAITRFDMAAAGFAGTRTALLLCS